MAIFQPSNIIPSTFAGVGGGTISVSDNVYVSWQVNGNSPLTAFIIDIYPNTGNATTDSQIVHTTGSISVSPSFYGVDEKGNVVRFEYKPTSTTWSSWGLTNGNNYKMKITQKWSNNASDTVVQYSESAFITRSAPSLTISSSDVSGGAISKGKATFTATYSQAQGDTINQVRWRLVRILSMQVSQEIENTGFVDTQKLTFTYDRFIQSPTNWRILCDIITSSGVSVTASMYFNVSFTPTQSTNTIMTTPTSHSGVKLSWGKGVDINGLTSNPFSCSYAPQGGINITNGYAFWNTVDNEPMAFSSKKIIWNGEVQKFTENTQTVTLSTMTPLPNGNTRYSYTYSLTSSDKRRISNVVFTPTTSTYGGTVKYSKTEKSVTVYVDIPYVMTITISGSLKITYARAYTHDLFSAILSTETKVGINGSDEILLSNSSLSITKTVSIPLYARYSTIRLYFSTSDLFLEIYYFDENKLSIRGTSRYEVIPISTTSATKLSQLKIYGDSTNGGIWHNFLSVGDWGTTPIWATDMAQPEKWETESVFLATFLNSLQGGTISSSGDFSNVFFRVGNDGEVFLSSFPLNSTEFIDFGFKSRTKYFYEMFFKQSDIYSTVTKSQEVCYQLNCHTLYEARQDSDNLDVFHVVKAWDFQGNVSSMAITNNNTPSWQTNFTPYRFKQPTARIGKSGTLQGLLGNVFYAQQKGVWDSTTNYKPLSIVTYTNASQETTTYYALKQNKGIEPEHGDLWREYWSAKDCPSVIYQDTAKDQEELFNASLSENTFFLKDMKGNLYMVAISSPITQTINNKTEQEEVVVSIPWEEVGSAEKISLVALTTDEGFIGEE